MDDSTQNSDVAPLTQLLLTHAELVNDTSDELAVALTDRLQTLQDLLAGALPDDRAAAVQTQISEMYVALQIQDILRQQVTVLERGLTVLSPCNVPDGVDAEEWRETALEQIKDAYVMRAQHEAHSRAFNLSVDEEDAVPQEVFF